MTTQDLTNNRDRIVKKINSQIALATKENIVRVMTKMVAMLPQFEDVKPTMANIDKLTMKATLNYIKYEHTHNTNQANVIDATLEQKRKESLQSSLQS